MQALIEKYDFGLIVINGKTYSSDVIVLPNSVIDDWWRLEGHRLQIPDVRDYLLEDIDAVVVGTGYDGMMRVDDEVINAFRKEGKEVHVLRSREAVRKYNELVKSGKKVMLLIHLTC